MIKENCAFVIYCLKNHSSLQVQCLLSIVSCTGQKCFSKMKPLKTHDRQGVQEFTSLLSLPVLVFLSIHKTTAPVAVCPLQTHLSSGTVFALTALSRTSPLCAHAGE